MRSPTGVEPAEVRVFGEPGTSGHVVTGDHRIEVPLDHGAPDRGTITVYAREVRAAAHAGSEQPYLVFLQGGPGGRAPRPGADAPGWLEWALARYRVLLLDQRGTGRSTPMDRHTLARLGSPSRQAEHLARFRADAIVADAECLRRHLLGDRPWTALGQSFGGFCTWTYLSFAPEGLDAALVTGGVPPVGVHPDDVYVATTAATERRVRHLDAVHPQARVVLAEVARHLERTEEHLPTGERLTARRLAEIGALLGGAGGPDRLALLAEDAWSLPGQRLSDTFLAAVADAVSYATRPLYALVHEACYAEGGVVTGWSARRVRQRLGYGDEPVPGPDGVERLPLTGETVHPHTVTADPALAPLAEAAHLLAERSWTEPLYDRDRLRANRVPVAACVYTEDMFVDPALSRTTAAATGAVRVVEDGTHHHDGLRRAGPEILDRLAAELGGAVPEPRPLTSEAS